MNDKFSIWYEENHESEGLGHDAVTRGKLHDCLGMTLDYSKKKEVLIDITEHADQMKEDFPIELKNDTKAWSDKLFSADKNNEFHSFAMKPIFSFKRGRPDVKLVASFLYAINSKSEE